MNAVLRFAFILLTLGAPYLASASREGVLSASVFQFSSGGIGDSGSVTVTGEQTAERFVSFTVSAFGHRISLSKSQLQKLKAGLVNGVQLSYEPGYKQTGGRTVYVVLSKGFTTGIQESQVVSVNERGSVEIKDGTTK